MTDPNVWPGKIGRTWQDSKPWLDPFKRPAEGAPNIVLVVLDDVGFAHLGCYGSTISTPNIDRLAAHGRRYTNFHTTSMCSPTRASLLTGCNHHAVGMGIIADMGTGFPGYQGEVSERAATLPEIMVPQGYSAFMTGKWHLTRAREMTQAGPYRQWPLGRGFERFYGFLFSLVDQWRPELVRDNTFIDPPADRDYHLSEAIVDEAINMIHASRSADPDRPFFSYVAFGACHSPHQAPASYVDPYRGAFDEGWDVMRERWHASQIELGIAPPDSKLTPRNCDVKPWAELSADERRVCARHQEVFAGFLTHTDAQIGRLMDWLESAGLSDNTMVVVMSDNGASAEGGEFGHINLRRFFQFHHEKIDEHLAVLDELGSDKHWNTYPAGWGHAGNTPHKWFKMQTHGGGVRDPMIIHWPARIKNGGEISHQFCHVADIAPTILEITGIEPAETVRGKPAIAMQGTSIAYTFDAPDAPTRKRVQHFELMGNRGIWADGWKAVTRHYEGDDYETEHWELYHLDSDFSESEDVSAKHPEKLAELKALWEREAEANNVFPLDDRNLSRLPLTYFLEPRSHWEYGPGGVRVSGYAAPAIGNRSWRFAIDVTLRDTQQGTILSAGGNAGGYGLYLEAGHLVFEYVGPSGVTAIISQVPLQSGRSHIAVDFRKTRDCGGILRLLCHGTEIAAGKIDDMWPSSPMSGSFRVAETCANPAPFCYGQAARLDGVIHHVAAEGDDDYRIDREMEMHIALSED